MSDISDEDTDIISSDGGDSAEEDGSSDSQDEAFMRLNEREGIAGSREAPPLENDNIEHEKEDENVVLNVVLQHQLPLFSNAHTSGTDFVLSTKWENNRPGDFMLDSLGGSVDLDQSYVTVEIDFTEYLKALLAISTKFLVYDDQPSDTTTVLGTTSETPGVTQPMNIRHRLIPMIDNNAIDHMWIRKNCSVGKSMLQVSKKTKLDLMLECEKKRSGELPVGRGSLSYMTKMYPLYCSNINELRNKDEDARVSKWLQGYDGRVYRKLSLGKSDGAHMCKEAFTVPLRWFLGNPICRVDGKLPELFNLNFEAVCGCFGEIVRFGLMPGTDMFNSGMSKWSNTEPTPANRLDPRYAIAWPDEYQSLKVFPSKFHPYRVTTGTTWYSNITDAGYVDIPGRTHLPGEVGRPIIEVDMSNTNTNPLTLKQEKWPEFSQFCSTQRLPISATGTFRIKLQSPSIKTKEVQANYYHDDSETTMMMRTCLDRIVVGSRSIGIGESSSDILLMSNGIMDSQLMMPDTSDYYKLFFVEDRPSRPDKFPQGMGVLDDLSVWSDYLACTLNDVWRLPIHNYKRLKSIQWTLTQTTGRDLGVQSNRTVTLPLKSSDDWYVRTADFQSFLEIPSIGLGSEIVRAEHGYNNIPIRKRLPCVLISTQYDDSMTTFNGQPPSKPRFNHLISFRLNVTTAETKPFAELEMFDETIHPMVVYILTASTQTIHFYRNGEVSMNVTEETVN